MTDGAPGDTAGRQPYELDQPVDAQRCAKKGLHIATRDVVEAKRTF